MLIPSIMGETERPLVGPLFFIVDMLDQSISWRMKPP
jgi:hypothetical protein